MRLLLTFTLLLSSLAVTYVHASEMTSKPNILLIMVDDMNEDTVDAVIGGKEVTPRINALKQEGISFERAHVNVAVCQPSRQILMTGKHPHQIGALGFTPIDESVTTLGEVLSENGYFNGIFCKEHHLAPEHKYAWDVVGGTDAMHQGRSIEEFYNRTREFIEMAQSKKQPFFLMANSEDPHRPLYGTVAEKRRFGKILHNFSEPSAIFTAADVDTLMPWVDHLPFNANARRKCEEDLAAYYSSCRRADDSVRRILDALDEMGEADNTIVIFMSDNGMAFPGAKWQTYQAATHTPFIVRWPKGGIVSGTVNSEDFISNIDFMPTILEAVGLKNQTPTDLAGKSFYPLLKGGTSPERDSLVTAHYSATAPRPLTEDSIKRGFSMPKEGAPVNETHIRCYQDAQFAYIYNHWSDQLKTYILGGDGGMGNFIKNTSAEGVKAYRDFMFYRVPEEFYDLRNDPHSLNNLIDDPAYQDTIESYRDKLLAWMVEEMDPKRGDFETFRSDLASPPVEPQRGSAKNHVINGDFESGGAGQGVVPEPWLMSGETDHVKLIWTEEVSGNQVLKLHKERVGRDNFDPAYQIKMYDNRTDDFAAKVFQVISGLPDGNYSLKARVRKEGAFFERAHLCAFTEGGMEHSVVIPTSLSMQTVFVRDIPVRGGQCTIGIDTEVFAGMWTQPAVFLDDIEFFRQPGGETPVMTNEANGAFVMPNARAGSLFYQSIHWILGGAGKEEFTYEKVTGPDWLKLSRDGILKGTPFSRDIGRAVVVVRKSEMQGRSSNVTFTFDVTAAVPDYDLSRGQSLIDLAQPNGPARLRASGMPGACRRPSLGTRFWTLLNYKSFGVGSPPGSPVVGLRRCNACRPKEPVFRWCFPMSITSIRAAVDGSVLKGSSSTKTQTIRMRWPASATDISKFGRVIFCRKQR
jgi:N-sulfoglucosamine sulfohydrolase